MPGHLIVSLANEYDKGIPAVLRVYCSLMLGVNMPSTTSDVRVSAHPSGAGVHSSGRVVGGWVSTT